MNGLYQRSAALAVLMDGAGALILDRRGQVVAEGARGRSLADALERLETPVERDRALDLLARHLDSVVSAAPLLEPVGQPAHHPDLDVRGRRLVICCCGAVQSLLMPSFLMQLQMWGIELQVVLTASATSFLSPDALRSAGLVVWTDEDLCGPLHIKLARWAQLVVVAPATANSLAKLANGICDNLVSLVVTATQAPVLVAPTMNPIMWRNPSTRRNLETLVANGITVARPAMAREVADTDAPPRWGAGMGLSAFHVRRVLLTL